MDVLRNRLEATQMDAKVWTRASIGKRCQTCGTTIPADNHEDTKLNVFSRIESKRGREEKAGAKEGQGLGNSKGPLCKETNLTKTPHKA
jgi:hypothetical protein